MYLLSIDQGSSSSRALIIDQEGQPCGYGQTHLPCLYPQPGWVEQDPVVLADGVAQAITEAVGQAGCHPAEIAACGITTQRDTDFVWDKRTGEPLANAISWQDLRTTPMVTSQAEWEQADERRQRLGYFPGAYCAALHLAWRMTHDPIIQEAARQKYLAIGSSADWLLNRLGNPNGHQLDYSLVQSLGLLDFRAQHYWLEWLDYLHIPRKALPHPVPTIYEFGTIHVTSPTGAETDVPVLATIGNEQAALFGHQCYQPGQAECSHGTASFVDVFVGTTAPIQDTLNVYHAWQLNDTPTYCLEADTTVSGAAIRWMQEQAGFFEQASELGPLAASVPDAGGVIFVPAFTGLNVPYNNPTARGSILGLTLGTTKAHICRAFLDSLGYQLRAILETIETETNIVIEQLSVGGGIALSDTACQIQANLIGKPVVRPGFTELAAHAGALLAGIGAGFWSAPAELPPIPGKQTIFEPLLTNEQRDTDYTQWKSIIKQIC